jgi:hypothetical protein
MPWPDAGPSVKQSIDTCSGELPDGATAARDHYLRGGFELEKARFHRVVTVVSWFLLAAICLALPLAAGSGFVGPG